MAVVPSATNYPLKTEAEYYVKFVNTIEQIQQNTIMIRLGICYTTCRPKTQTVAPNIPGYNISGAASNIWLVTFTNISFIPIIIMMDPM